MIVPLVVALTAGWAVSVVALAGLIRSQHRAHARREDLLINQLLHAVGRDWQPAPADERAPAPEPEERYWTATPDQDPVY